MINQVIHGDCLEVLKTIPDNYFDSLITDPPAGISFMGKNWDDHKGGMLNWVNWFSEVMNECLRTMKPGACGLVWSIPRTSHWTGMALELAGFRLIDCVHHCFGCLSEDTEIFVKDKGWVHYQQCETGDTVIGYNIENNSFSYQNVTKTYRFNYSDTAYRIESDSTEQIVSIGHRCIIEQDGAFVFREASTLEQQVSVPFLETMPLLQHTISSTQCLSSDEECSLLRSLYKGIDSQSQGREESTTMCLPRVSDRVLPQNKSINSEILLSDMRGQRQKEKSKNVRTSQEHCKTGTCWLDRKESGILCNQHGWGKQPSMEGWCNDIQKERELQECPLCQMSQGLSTNGTERRLCNGTSFDNGSTSRKSSVENGSCASYQSQSDGQQDRELDAISEQSRSQIIRTRQSGCKTTLATVTPFHYEGVVWCVSVPDTAFVARRNGKIFVTGNSGFPKGQDLSKILDKMANAEREVVGRKNPHLDGSKRKVLKGFTGSVDLDYQGINLEDGTIPVTAPTAPEAKQWDGWKTPALKPAVEGWWLVQKPISESSIARNMLKHGVGGINIEACRIGDNKKVPGSLSKNNRTVYNGGYVGESGDEDGHNPNIGRYPANLILSCGADCEGDNHSPDCPVSVIGEQSGICTVGEIKPHKQKSAFFGTGGNFNGYYPLNTGTAARYFKQLPFDPETVNSIYYQAKASTKDRTSNGTVENTHPTVKSTALMEYFIKLITPPNGIVLDPFGGSGTTGVAAKKTGFNYVLIEKEQEYVDIINQRLTAPVVTPQPTLEERVQWLETQVKAQDNKIKKLEKQQYQQLSLFG